VKSAQSSHSAKFKSLNNFIQIMEIKLQLPDAVYASLLKGNTRIQGSIALVSPREGNFNAHHKRKNPPAREYRKLPHGRVSINTESLRLTLNVGLDEHRIIPAQVLLSESLMASHFVEGMTLDEIPNH
jgi:hypothetical protein